MLNRLSIVEVGVDTPKVVLEEIAQAHSIRYISTNEDKDYIRRVIDKIHKAIEEDRYLPDNYWEDPTSLKKIARYVNPNCAWKKTSLLSAFNFLTRFHGEKNFDDLFSVSSNLPERENKFGPQTSDSPL